MILYVTKSGKRLELVHHREETIAVLRGKPITAWVAYLRCPYDHRFQVRCRLEEIRNLDTESVAEVA